MPARIPTKAEMDRIGREAEARTRRFGKTTSDKFAREAKSRVEAFKRRSGA